MEQNMQAQAAAPAVTSFGTRAVNVLSAPGELYSEVAAVPVQTTSWLIPYLLMVALVVLMMFSFTNNPILYEQMLEPQRKELARQVASGDITQAQADQAAQFTSNKGMFLAFGILAGVFIMSLVMFGAPLALWLGSKFVLKYPGGYKKILEVYGLALVIGIVGTLVSLIMMNMMQSMFAQPSGAFFIRDIYDQDNFGHNVLASLNVFSIWQMAAVGIGLGAVSGKSSGKGMMVAFGLWAVYVVCASLMGWGAR